MTAACMYVEMFFLQCRINNLHYHIICTHIQSIQSCIQIIVHSHSLYAYTYNFSCIMHVVNHEPINQKEPTVARIPMCKLHIKQERIRTITRVRGEEEHVTS